MAGKIIPLKRTIKISKRGLAGKSYQIAGKPLTCPFCNGSLFMEGHYTALLLTYSLICGACSNVQLYKKLPKLAAS